MKKILITGVAGFLGSNLAKKLLEDKNVFVIGIDNFYTGLRKNIIELEKSSNFKFIEHDIVNSINLQEKIDEIYNLACPASPPQYQKNPIYTTKINIFGILNMISLAKEHSAKLLQASTSEVYGDPLQHPQSEEYRGNVSCTGIRACYDEGKRVAESILFDYYRETKLPIKVVRIFNTYGPNMDKNDGRVVSNFITQALTNQDITIYGDGSQTRSFCYVDDLINGFIKFMNSSNEVTGPINMGNPIEFTIKELAEKILKVLPTKSKIIYKDLPKDDPTKRKPNITLAKNLLGWEPIVVLNEGLEKTIEYFKKEVSS